MTRKQLTAIAAGAVALVAFLVFFGSIGAEFVWDDPIVFDRQLPFFDGVKNIFVPPQGIPQFGDHYYRPLVVVSYLADEGIAKTFWPLEKRDAARRVVFHLTPVALHALATALVFLFGLQLLGLHAPPGPKEILAAAAGALLFAVHPIHVESVAWMAGRSDALCAVFFLGAAIALVEARRRSSLRWGLLSAACFLLATLAKETGLGFVFLAPVLLWLVRPADRAALEAEAAKGTSRAERRRIQRAAGTPARTKGMKGGSANAAKGTKGGGAEAREEAKRAPAEGWSWATLPAVAFLAALVAYFALRSAAIAAVTSPAMKGAPDLTALPAAFGWYAAKLFWPPPQSAFPAEVPGVGFAVFGAVALAAALFGAWRWRRGGERTPELAALAFSFAGLVLSLAISLYKISKTPIAERYLYIPSAGLCLLAAFLLRRAATRLPAAWPGRARIGAPLIVAAVVALPATAATIERQQVWADNYSFWRDAAAKAPDQGVPHLHLGMVYAGRGANADAEREYRLALKYYKEAPSLAKTNNNLGSLLFQRGRDDEAVACFVEAARLDPRYETPHYNWALLLLRRSQSAPPEQRGQLIGDALGHLERALAINPRYTKAHLQLGEILLQLGRPADGAEHLRFVVELAPASAEAQMARNLLARAR